MREKCLGIVLSIIPFNVKYSIVHIYSDKFGRVSYKLPLSKSKKSKVKKSVFFPLSFLEMEVEHIHSKDIQKIMEVMPYEINHSIMMNPIKSGVVFFLAEFLNLTIKEHEKNLSLFTFITESIKLYNILNEDYANFHIAFIIQITNFLGIKVDNSKYNTGDYLDMMEGIFTSQLPIHPYYLGQNESYIFSKIFDMNYSNMNSFKFNRVQRNYILDNILLFTKLHIPEIKEFNTVDVLKELFN